MGTVINPNGKSWFATASGVTVIGTTKTYQTYADLLREQYPGKLAWVVDASGDPSVDKGSALYTWRSLSKTWEKIYETEMLDGGSSVIQNFVGWVATPEQLRAMYPNASDGWYAIVGTTDSIWVWDSDTNDWKDTTTMDGEIMWSQIVDPPSSYPITFITGLREELDSRVLNATLEEFYPKKSDLALVATTGSYTDLTNLPDIDGIIIQLICYEEGDRLLRPAGRLQVQGVPQHRLPFSPFLRLLVHKRHLKHEHQVIIVDHNIALSATGVDHRFKISVQGQVQTVIQVKLSLRDIVPGDPDHVLVYGGHGGSVIYRLLDLAVLLPV